MNDFTYNVSMLESFSTLQTVLLKLGMIKKQEQESTHFYHLLCNMIAISNYLEYWLPNLQTL